MSIADWDFCCIVISWLFQMQEDVANETETGKVYRAACVDKQGHSVLVMRPARQVNSSYQIW